MFQPTIPKAMTRTTQNIKAIHTRMAGWYTVHKAETIPWNSGGNVII